MSMPVQNLGAVQENLTAEEIWNDILKIRQKKPLVHNITNYVVMEFTANALLALGASPVMAHAVEEVEEMTTLAQALVINIGTLSPHWLTAMVRSAKIATQQDKPWVLDPVGIGATSYRTAAIDQILKAAHPSAIRGNASEIGMLAKRHFSKGVIVRPKGVDAAEGISSNVETALKVAQQYQCIVAMNGPIDWVCDTNHYLSLHNGHPWMSQITGMGCTASALTAAFLAVNSKKFKAVAAAQALMGVVGQYAQLQSSGLGDFKTRFLDVLGNVTLDLIQTTLQQNHAA